MLHWFRGHLTEIVTMELLGSIIRRRKLGVLLWMMLGMMAGCSLGCIRNCLIWVHQWIWHCDRIIARIRWVGYLYLLGDYNIIAWIRFECTYLDLRLGKHQITDANSLYFPDYFFLLSWLLFLLSWLLFFTFLSSRKPKFNCFIFNVN